MKRLSLRMKLAVGFGTPLLILVIVGVASIYSIRRLSDVSLTMQQRTGSNVLMRTVEVELDNRKTDIRSFLLSDDEKYMRNYEEQDRLLVEKLSELEQRLTTEKGREMLAHIHQAADAYDRDAQRVAGLEREGKRKEAVDLLLGAEMNSIRAEMEKTVVEFVENGEGLLKAAREQQAATESEMTTIFLVLILAGLAAGLGMAIYIARNLTGRISQMVGMIQAIAASDLSLEDMQIRNHDEIGSAGNLLNSMKNNLRKIVQSIAEHADHVATASEELSATSQQISANSEETSAQVNVVSQATKQVSQNLQSVSTGSEEMTSTIQSIASNAHEAATVASNAVQTAQAANANVAKLGASSAEIGEVIKVITSIAQQTNLLALNATIEAARAGEAGKGFAVVANEVKELAKQTAKATEDISRKIAAIQTDTQGAVEAIGTISGVISQINDISGTIATAVEEQSATTNEMTRNVADAAKGSGEITQNIEGVAEAARGTSSSAQESQKAANDLAEMAAQLHSLVGQFELDETARLSVTSAAQDSVQSMAARAGR